MARKAADWSKAERAGDDVGQVGRDPTSGGILVARVRSLDILNGKGNHWDLSRGVI